MVKVQIWVLRLVKELKDHCWVSLGSANFLSRTTSILATIFFSTALALSIVPQESSNNSTDGILEELTNIEPEQETGNDLGLNTDAVPTPQTKDE